MSVGLGVDLSFSDGLFSAPLSSLTIQRKLLVSPSLAPDVKTSEFVTTEVWDPDDVLSGGGAA